MANEKPGGHGERSVAVGTLDMALWDALAKVHDLPLWRLLSSRYNGGQHDPEVSVYAAGGYYYPGKGLADLQDEMKSYLDRGFVNVKMKIGGLPKPGAARGAVPEGALEMDRERIEAVLRILPPGSRLAVDANGRFDLATAVAYGEMLKPYVLDSRILWYEEVGEGRGHLDGSVMEVLARPTTRSLLFARRSAEFGRSEVRRKTCLKSPTESDCRVRSRP